MTFEGGEGTGKSTQARLLAERIRETGRDVLLTREPGGSPRAERIRQALLSGTVRPLGPVAEAMMLAAARLDHLAEAIRRLLARGAAVVCDRFVDSTRVYQGLLEGVAPDLLAGLERIVVGPTMPNLTVILDIDPVEGLARARARRRGRAFLRLAEQEPARWLVLDAARPPDELARTIWLLIRARFPDLRGARPA